LQWRGWIPAASHVVSGILFGALGACVFQGPRAHAAIVRPDHGSYGGGSPSASCGALVGLVSRAPDLVVPETFEKARRVAPGWDIYFLEGLWRAWIAGKEELKTRMPLLLPSAAKSINGRDI
jgi:hypothetical protein